MNAAEIRQSFLDFFEEKGHHIVPSAPLLPSAPNLLFTNAGMNPFVPYFLGERAASFRRVADTQKCIRAGGKHNDLEDVGFDTYHHTFFEMLGNWSFGDYFKKEAIAWAWELLTQRWGFPRERLYATVYQPGPGEPAEFDQEAWDCWTEIFRAEGLDPKQHLKTGGKKDNFWMMGATGPCGPCSEIHIDLTERGDSNGALVNQDTPRCIEVWNLVFIQFNAGPDGSFKPLTNRYVDTGMGFERVAGIMASTHDFSDFSHMPSNYDSDLFADVFAQLTERSGHYYQGTVPKDRDRLTEVEMNDCAFRILADHARTLACAIADGIIPGNEGRNYVLRRILRRAVLWANRLGLGESALVTLVSLVVAKLGTVFPELKTQEETIKRVIASEEGAFERTIDRGLQLLEKIAARQSERISGEDAFTLYDTYGFPLDLTQLIAREKGLVVDTAGFEKEMEKQRARARAAQKKTIVSVKETEEAETPFTGFDHENLTGFKTTVEDIVRTNDTPYLVFARSPFYAEMGGQIGDTGEAILKGDIRLPVLNTIKDGSGRFLHQTKTDKPDALIGEAVVLNVNKERRRAIERHHTATHILHWALRKVLGKHVQQAGSLVTDKRLRFDFAHFEQPSPQELKEIEKLTNRQILQNAKVDWHEVPFDEKPENCIAFFGEKYGSRVRVVDIGNWSLELCGGTHVQATGEIGLCKIVSESAIAAGTRRIEAVVGESAMALAESHDAIIQTLCARFSCKATDLEERLKSLFEQCSTQEKELRSLKKKGIGERATALASGAKKGSSGLHFVAAKVEATNPSEMRNFAVQTAAKLGPGLIVLGGVFGAKATVLALSSKEAIEKGYAAGEIVRKITSQCSGKGGGKPDFAMGGGCDPDKLSAALAAFLEEAEQTPPQGRQKP